MSRAHAAALGLAAVGTLICLSSGALAAASPDLRDAVHAFGLVIMLAAAVVFLTASRRPRDDGTQLRRIRAPAGAAETAGNLAIAGATFLAGSMAAGLAFRWLLRPDMLAYWVLIGLGILGAGAMIAGAGGFAFMKLIGRPGSSRQEDGS